MTPASPCARSCAYVDGRSGCRSMSCGGAAPTMSSSASRRCRERRRERRAAVERRRGARWRSSAGVDPVRRGHARSGTSRSTASSAPSNAAAVTARRSCGADASSQSATSPPRRERHVGVAAGAARDVRRGESRRLLGVDVPERRSGCDARDAAAARASADRHRAETYACIPRALHVLEGDCRRRGRPAAHRRADRAASARSTLQSCASIVTASAARRPPRSRAARRSSGLPGSTLRLIRGVAVGARAVEQRRQQLVADALAAAARHDGDRQLGRLLVDEAVAGLGGREEPVPRGADAAGSPR